MFRITLVIFSGVRSISVISVRAFEKPKEWCFTPGLRCDYCLYFRRDRVMVLSSMGLCGFEAILNFRPNPTDWYTCR